MALNLAIPTEESIIEFAEVYLQAVELSWRDKEFRTLLLENPMYALQHYFHYNSPWNFRLNVNAVDAKDPIYKWDERAQTWNLPKNSISVGLPKSPKLNEQAVALALYSNAGPSYLFSCC